MVVLEFAARSIPLGERSVFDDQPQLGPPLLAVSVVGEQVQVPVAVDIDEPERRGQVAEIEGLALLEAAAPGVQVDGAAENDVDVSVEVDVARSHPRARIERLFESPEGASPVILEQDRRRGPAEDDQVEITVAVQVDEPQGGQADLDGKRLLLAHETPSGVQPDRYRALASSRHAEGVRIAVVVDVAEDGVALEGRPGAEHAPAVVQVDPVRLLEVGDQRVDVAVAIRVGRLGRHAVQPWLADGLPAVSEASPAVAEQKSGGVAVVDQQKVRRLVSVEIGDGDAVALARGLGRVGEREDL